MNYFAYGSNINVEHFSAYLADHGVDPDNVANCRHATLSDHPTVTNCKFIGNAVAGLRVVRSLAETDLSI